MSGIVVVITFFELLLHHMYPMAITMAATANMRIFFVLAFISHSIQYKSTQKKISGRHSVAGASTRPRMLGAWIPFFRQNSIICASVMMGPMLILTSLGSRPRQSA